MSSGDLINKINKQTYKRSRVITKSTGAVAMAVSVIAKLKLKPHEVEPNEKQIKRKEKK